MPYNSTEWVRNAVRSLMALPLLYQHLIDDQFDKIVNTIDERRKQAKKIKRASNDSSQGEKAREEIMLCEMLRDLFNYFERYWINTITSAMFCVQGLQRRTNNAAEGICSLSIAALIRSSSSIGLDLGSFNNKTIIQFLF